jgi:hypothetical protein
VPATNGYGSRKYNEKCFWNLCAFSGWGLGYVKVKNWEKLHDSAHQYISNAADILLFTFMDRNIVGANKAKGGGMSADTKNMQWTLWTFALAFSISFHVQLTW